MPARKRTIPGRSGHDYHGWIEAVVRDCRVPEERFDDYLRFALELYVTLRRGERRHRREGCPTDYSRPTKLVVMKWFRRGLHGYLLWAIGAALIRRRFGLGRYESQGEEV